MKHLKLFEEYDKGDKGVIELGEIKYRGHDLMFYYYQDPSDESKKIIWADDINDGEPYIDVTTILPKAAKVDNSVWVKLGGQEEELADRLVEMGKLQRRDVHSSSGYNKYAAYTIL